MSYCINRLLNRLAMCKVDCYQPFKKINGVNFLLKIFQYQTNKALSFAM